MNKYQNHSICIARNSLLPVSSNQKMNEYLKEIADLCGFDFTLNTHKARRTFGSTITLNNDVPIHVVREMLGHSSVTQTEEYAITEQRTVGRQMKELTNRLNRKADLDSNNSLSILERLEKEILDLKEQIACSENNLTVAKVSDGNSSTMAMN